MSKNWNERLIPLYRLLAAPNAESHWRAIVERAKSIAAEGRAAGNPVPLWVQGLAAENANHEEIARERIAQALQEAEAEAWGFPPPDAHLLEAYTRSRWLLELYPARVDTPFGERLAALVCARGRMAVVNSAAFWPVPEGEPADSRVAREAAYLIADFPGLPAGQTYFLKSLEAPGATAISSAGAAYALRADGRWSEVGEAEPPELIGRTLAAASQEPYSERFYSRAIKGAAGRMGLRVIALSSGHLFFAGLWKLHEKVALDEVQARKLQLLAEYPSPDLARPGLPAGELLQVAEPAWLPHPMARAIGKGERYYSLPYGAVAMRR